MSIVIVTESGCDLTREEAARGFPPAYESIHDATLTIATHMGVGAVGISAILPT